MLFGNRRVGEAEPLGPVETLPRALPTPGCQPGLGALGIQTLDCDTGCLDDVAVRMALRSCPPHVQEASAGLLRA